MQGFHLLRLVVRSIKRRPGRTILTVLGLAVLVLMYVGIQSLVTTLQVNLSGSISALGGEIDVWSRGASYPLISRIPENYTRIIGAIPGVSTATPVALAVSTFEADVVVAVGLVPANIPLLIDYQMVLGSMITTNQTGVLAMGRLLAETVEKTTGDIVLLNGEPFQVLGVYRTESWVDHSVIIPLSVAQRAFGIEGGASMIIVITQDPRNVDIVIEDIETRLPTVEAFRRLDAPSRVSPLFSSVENATTAMIIIVTLGAILGVMNSNLNSLRDRSRSFAIFKAVGASRTQMIRIVLYESLLLGGLGAAVGGAVSYLTLRFLSIPIAEGLSVNIELIPLVFVYGVLLVLGASLTAAVYPAFRIAHVRPQEVFRFG